MTQFDFLVLGLLLFSAAVGFFRGAVREIFALLALVTAAAMAIFGLPVFGPMLRDAVHSTWFAAVVSLIVVFVVAFIALRLIGAAIARQVQNTQMLGLLDRSLGLLIGLGRGLIVLGALFLMFNAATPADLRPRWITEARTWPLATSMGALIEKLMPQGMDVAGRLKPAFDRAVGQGSGDRSTTDGYEAREPTSSDRQERSR